MLPARPALYVRQLLELGERELSAYEPVLEAFALDAGDPDREARLRAALSDAADSPLEIARAAAVVASLGAELAADREHESDR